MTQTPIFFIDDETSFLNALRRYFGKVTPSWSTAFFEDPLAALPQVTAAPAAVVVVDWTMPQMDGLTFCRKIKATPDARYHVIMLTGHTGPGVTVDALEDGADDYLSKPVSMVDLRTHIELGLARLERGD